MFRVNVSSERGPTPEQTETNPKPNQNVTNRNYKNVTEAWQIHLASEQKPVSAQLKPSSDGDIVSLAVKHSDQSVATSFKDTETHRSRDRADLQTEKMTVFLFRCYYKDTKHGKATGGGPRRR